MVRIAVRNNNVRNGFRSYLRELGHDLLRSFWRFFGIKKNYPFCANERHNIGANSALYEVNAFEQALECDWRSSTGLLSRTREDADESYKYHRKTGLRNPIAIHSRHLASSRVYRSGSRLFRTPA